MCTIVVRHLFHCGTTLALQRTHGSTECLPFDVISSEVTSDSFSEGVTASLVLRCRRSRSSLDTISIYGIQNVVLRYCPSSLFIPLYLGALLCRWISRDSLTDLSKCLCSVLSILASLKAGPTGHALACWAAPDRSHCSLVT